MHFEIDRHGDGDSPVHRLDGRLRIVVVLFWAVAILWLDSLWASALGLLLALGVVLLMRIPLRETCYRLTGVVVILSPLLLLYPLLADDGKRLSELARAAGMLMRGSALMLLSYPVFNAARLNVTMASFRSLAVPKTLITVFLLAYRALFIFLEDRRRMELSARTRGWQGRSGRRALALSASHVGSLLVRSLDRTERLWFAMRSRAYDGEFPLAAHRAIGRSDVVTAALLVVPPVLLKGAEYYAGFVGGYGF